MSPPPFDVVHWRYDDVVALTPAQRQRRYQERKRAERSALPKVLCACGCGTEIAPISSTGKPARYAHGHNPSGEGTRFRKGQEAWNRGRPAPWATATKKGKPLQPEAVAKRQATRRAKAAPAKRGWKHTPETIARMTEVNRANARSGEANPFYGRRHTPDVIARMFATRLGAVTGGSRWKSGGSGAASTWGSSTSAATKTSRHTLVTMLPAS